MKIRRVTSVLSTTNDAIAVISFPCFNVLNKFSSFKLLLRCEQWEFTERADRGKLALLQGRSNAPDVRFPKFSIAVYLPFPNSN